MLQKSDQTSCPELLPDIKYVHEIKTMADVMEVCRFVKFEFGDQVPTIKPHIERLDEVSSTEPHAQQVLQIQSQAEEGGGVTPESVRSTSIT